MAWLLFLVLCALFYVTYRWGHHDGYEAGYGKGYIAGNNKAVEKFHPDLSLVKIVPPSREDLQS